MKKVISALLLLCVCSGASLHAIYYPPPPSPRIPDYQSIYQTEELKEFDSLLLTMQKYLSIQHELARVVWNDFGGYFNESMVREKAICYYTELASSCGLQGEHADIFIVALVDASISAVRTDIATWRKEQRQPFPYTVDLQHEWIPCATRLVTQIFEQLNRVTFPVFEQLTTCGKLPQPISQRAYDLVDPTVWKILVGCYRIEIMEYQEEVSIDS